MNEVISCQVYQYRQKAEEVRVTAENTRDLACREALQRLAAGYDRLADNVERVVSRASDEADREQPAGS